MTTHPSGASTGRLTRACEASVDDASGVCDAVGVPVRQIRCLVAGVLVTWVAVLVALVGVTVSRAVLHLSAFTRGAVVATVPYVIAVAATTLGAALIYNLALHVATRPTEYFAALTGLGVALAASIPFTTAADLPSQVAVAVTNVGVGSVIGVLLPVATGRARH